MKILIADDNKDLVASLKERLQVAGFTTIEAYEGVRVIELTHQQNPLASSRLTRKNCFEGSPFAIRGKKS